MPFISGAKSIIKEVDNHFELSKEYLDKNGWRFKKIIATRLASVLGKNSFTSPFKIWCQMVNIYTEKMDKMVSDVGNAVEPKVRKFVEQHFRDKTGLDVKYSFYEPSKFNWDMWKGIDDVFGGIPDGEPYVDGKLAFDKGLPILEIKTSSIDAFKYKKEKGVFVLQKDEKGNPIVKELGTKKLHWYNDNGTIKVPEEYKYQLGLYMYLRNTQNGMIACVFVNTDDYPHPDTAIVDKNNIIAANINFDRNVFEKELQIARDWYYKYIKTGISPNMTEEDRKWIQEVEWEK